MIATSTTTEVEQLPPYFTVPELALRLKVSRAFLYRLMSAGEIRSVSLGRCRRIPRDAVREYEASLTGGEFANA